MSIKDKILHTLLYSNGKVVTGAELSCGSVSRNAVWKAVRTLQGEGYPIESVPNKGYTLPKGLDIPIAEDICKLTEGRFHPQVLWQAGSTNTLLRNRAEGGAPDGTVIIACTQQGGRGRMGRSFCSMAGGLYLSFLLRPQTSAGRGGDITGVAAVAVAEAIEAITGKKAYIKWVNDLYLEGKKVCGILTDASVSLEGGLLDYAVVGIGLNVHMPDGGFPSELKDIAGSLYKDGQGTVGLINRFAAEILCRFYSLFETPDKALEGYRSRCFLVGKTVTALRGEERRRLKVLGVADDYSLIIETADGEKQLLNSGEVSLRPEEVPK